MRVRVPQKLTSVWRGRGLRRGIVSAAVDGLRVARAVLGGHGSDVGAATGVEDPRDVAAVA